jgi:hypothetical protein
LGFFPVSSSATIVVASTFCAGTNWVAGMTRGARKTAWSTPLVSMGCWVKKEAVNHAKKHSAPSVTTCEDFMKKVSATHGTARRQKIAINQICQTN